MNLHDGKASSYIGSSVDIGRRWRQHRHALRQGAHLNAHLQAAWDKYSEDAFVFSVLEELEEVGGDVLLVMEQEYLNDYFDRGNCYNMRTEAKHCPLSEEAKHKIGDALRNRPLSEEHKRALREAAMNRPPISGEHRRKISESLKGRKGKPVSEETKRKLREANLGKRHTEETRRKVSAALRQRPPISEETRRKLSEAAKRREAAKREAASC